MKFDSHIKLTAAAIRLLKSRCPNPAACAAPLFAETRRVWDNRHASVRSDNWASAAMPAGRAAYALAIRKTLPFGELQAKAFFDVVDWLFPNDLAHCVAAVDVNEAWTHGHPEGQKYHFQRAPGESQYNGYLNALGFIHSHTSQWVNHTRTIAQRHSDPFGHGGHWETQKYKSELSLALHSLQDSFSTAHTVRSGAVSWGAPPIVELTVYDEQDKKKHSHLDYASGGLNTGIGRLAVEASADLIEMGIVSIGSRGGLIGWDRFVAKWLAERINRSPPNKVAQLANDGR